MFVPKTQRANVTESAKIGAIIHKLQAYDQDAIPNSLHFEVSEPITAIDVHGHPVDNPKVKVKFKIWRQFFYLLTRFSPLFPRFSCLLPRQVVCFHQFTF